MGLPLSVRRCRSSGGREELAVFSNPPKGNFQREGPWGPARRWRSHSWGRDSGEAGVLKWIQHVPQLAGGKVGGPTEALDPSSSPRLPPLCRLLVQLVPGIWGFLEVIQGCLAPQRPPEPPPRPPSQAWQLFPAPRLSGSGSRSPVPCAERCWCRPSDPVQRPQGGARAVPCGTRS